MNLNSTIVIIFTIYIYLEYFFYTITKLHKNVHMKICKNIDAKCNINLNI